MTSIRSQDDTPPLLAIRPRPFMGDESLVRTADQAQNGRMRYEPSREFDSPPPVLLCQTTRAQSLEAAVLADALRSRWPLFVLDTRTPSDLSLDGPLHDALGVEAPHYVLDVAKALPAEQTSAVLSRAATLIARLSPRPWAVVIFGNSDGALGCALAAAKLGLPVVHIENGLRLDSASAPSELNRRLIDALSTVLCAQSPSAAEHLCREQTHGMVFHTGDLARDVLERHASRAALHEVVSDWPLGAGERFVFAFLRDCEDENSRHLLREVFLSLSALELPVVVPLGPDARSYVTERGLLDLGGSVHVVPPLEYLAALAAIRDAAAVVTDSERVQREAYWLGTPSVTISWGTEWPETVREGATLLLPPHLVRARLLNTVRQQLESMTAWDRDVYGDGTAAVRVADSLSQIDVLAHSSEHV
jgi:UDP-N-acetylglucosamine 2-epimerase